MAWDPMQGRWLQFKRTVQEKWKKLDEQDLDLIAGRNAVLVGRLQVRYGYSKEEAERAVDEFTSMLET